MGKGGKNREWGYTSCYEDEETGELTFTYTSYEKDGSVNRYTDNHDGGHSHAHWDSADDYNAGEDPDFYRQESNDSPNPSEEEINDNGGCYLTTACMHHYKRNFDDDCYELTTLRWFRDRFVSLPDRFHYYKIAPQIVEAINKSPKKIEIYHYIYENVIDPCVKAIERKDYDFAYRRYKSNVAILENNLLKPKTIDENKDSIEHVQPELDFTKQVFKHKNI